MHYVKLNFNLKNIFFLMNYLIIGLRIISKKNRYDNALCIFIFSALRLFLLLIEPSVKELARSREHMLMACALSVSHSHCY